MSEESGRELIQIFLDKMEELKIKHYKMLPESVQQAFKNYKHELKFEKDVEKKAKLGTEFNYLRNLGRLKILGFNSSSYDLPCIMNHILELKNPEDVHVIKRGESLFALDVNGLSFRDAMNYCGPMSLKKFAAIFQLPISKGIFPYEKFHSVAEIYETTTWPSYKDFVSSLPSRKENFLPEINNILNLPMVYGIENFGAVLEFFQIDLEIQEWEKKSAFLPELSESQYEMIKNGLPISPEEFLSQKFEFESKINTGEYQNFLDYLIYYNLLDCDLLTMATKKFLEIFSNCFDVCLFERLSLPAISESIMWQYYDKNSPKMFSFSSDYGFLNKKIREKLQGGPTILFHRHAEVIRCKVFSKNYQRNFSDSYFIEQVFFII